MITEVEKLRIDLMDKTLELSEPVFYSIQGEGPTVGAPSLFVRLARCVFKCRFCDSSFTFAPGTHTKIDDIIDNIDKCRASRVVVTGGEPLIHKNVIPFIKLLKLMGLNVEVETAVPTGISESLKGLGIQWNLSPKLTSAEPKMKFRMEDVKSFVEDGGNLKFVHSCEEDLKEIKDIIQQTGASPSKIWLMTEGYTQDKQTANMEATIEVCKANGWNFSPRLHILVWGYRQGV